MLEERDAAMRPASVLTYAASAPRSRATMSADAARVLRSGGEAAIPVHIAHNKALGADVKGTSGALIKMIEDAQAAGQKVHADQYPWVASSTYLSAALIPAC